MPFEKTKDTSRLKLTISKYSLKWPQLIQLNDHPFLKPEMVRMFFVESFPTYILLNKNGIIVERTSDLKKIKNILSGIL